MLYIGCIICIISVFLAFYQGKLSQRNIVRTDEDLFVMSWNVRGSDLDSGPTTSWNIRKNLAREVLEYIHPDIIGLQEAQPNQKNFFTSFGYNLSETILYNPNKLTLVDSEIVWFSPDGTRVRAWDASSPRGVTWSIFNVKDNNESIIVFNLHLDHIGYQSRMESIKILKNTIQQIHQKEGFLPTLILGDFNSVKYTEVWDSVMELHFKDAALELYNQDGVEYTYHHFHGLHFNSLYMRIVQYLSYYASRFEIGRKYTNIPSPFAPSLFRSMYEAIFGKGKVHHIDWILYSNHFKPSQFQVITHYRKTHETIDSSNWYHPKELFHRFIVRSQINPSDHFPIFCSFNLIK